MFLPSYWTLFEPLTMTLTYVTIPLQVKGVNLNLSIIHNLNSSPLIMFLYGFGSCKEDLADIVVNPTMQHYGSGCGHLDLTPLRRKKPSIIRRII